MKEKLKQLKRAVKGGDNEEIHSIYDEIIEEIAKKHEPEKVKKINKIVKDTGSCYA